MPPGGRPRPDEATYKASSPISKPRSTVRPRRDRTGRTEALHRLNRAEYRNAVRDLLALDIDVSAMLPADDVSYGFDNIAGVQRMSPTLMERYMAAAQKISSDRGRCVAAAGDRRDTFLRATGAAAGRSARGAAVRHAAAGRRCSYMFPRDGMYNIRVQLTRICRRQLRRHPGVRRAAAAGAERRRHAGARVRAALHAGTAAQGRGPGPNRRRARRRLAGPVPGEGGTARRWR